MLQTHTLFILIVGILISWPRLSKAQADDMRQTDLVLMDGQWQWQVEEDRQSISLPFIDTKARRCTLDYRFCVPDSIGPDSLFLLFEGMACISPLPNRSGLIASWVATKGSRK
ncbi:MAG: hypothetical protein AAFQ87_18550, partial [Bacteroidota bacterium]